MAQYELDETDVALLHTMLDIKITVGTQMIQMNADVMPLDELQSCMNTIVNLRIIQAKLLPCGLVV